MDISFRRQSIVSLDRLVSDALAIFEPHVASADDHRLVAWLRLQLVAEDIENVKQKLELGNSSTVLALSEANFSSLDEKIQEWDRNYGRVAKNRELFRNIIQGLPNLTPPSQLEDRVRLLQKQATRTSYALRRGRPPSRSCLPCNQKH